MEINYTLGKPLALLSYHVVNHVCYIPEVPHLSFLSFTASSLAQLLRALQTTLITDHHRGSAPTLLDIFHMDNMENHLQGKRSQVPRNNIDNDLLEIYKKIMNDLFGLYSNSAVFKDKPCTAFTKSGTKA